MEWKYNAEVNKFKDEVFMRIRKDANSMRKWRFELKVHMRIRKCNADKSEFRFEYEKVRMKCENHRFACKIGILQFKLIKVWVLRHFKLKSMSKYVLSGSFQDKSLQNCDQFSIFLSKFLFFRLQSIKTKCFQRKKLPLRIKMRKKKAQTCELWLQPIFPMTNQKRRFSIVKNNYRIVDKKKRRKKHEKMSQVMWKIEKKVKSGEKKS